MTRRARHDRTAGADRLDRVKRSSMPGMGSRIVRVPLWLLSGAVFFTACGSPPAPAPAARESPDVAFTAVAHEVIDDLYRRQPSSATYLGIHKYDDRLEDYSRDAVASEVAALRKFRERANAIEPSALSQTNQLDREMLLHAID